MIELQGQQQQTAAVAAAAVISVILATVVVGNYDLAVRKLESDSQAKIY